MILDTEFLISLQAEEAAAVELATELEAAGVPTRIPTIVIEELCVSVGAGDFPTEKRPFVRGAGGEQTNRTT